MNEQTDLKKPRFNIVTSVMVVFTLMVFCAVPLYIGFWSIVFACHINNASTDATVMEKKMVSDDEGGPTYHVTYEYKAENNTYTNRTSYPKIVWDDIKTGDKIRIRYFAPMPGSGSVLDE